MRGGNSGVSTLDRRHRSARTRWNPVWPAYAASVWIIVYVLWVFLDLAGSVLNGSYIDETMLGTVLADSVFRAVTGVLILATVRPWAASAPDWLMLLLAWTAAGGNLAFPIYKGVRVFLSPFGILRPWPAPAVTLASFTLTMAGVLFLLAAVSYLGRNRASRLWAILGLFLGFLVMYLPASHL